MSKHLFEVKKTTKYSKQGQVQFNAETEMKARGRELKEGEEMWPISMTKSPFRINHDDILWRVDKRGTCE